MHRERWHQQNGTNAGAQGRIKFRLRNTTLVLLLKVGFLCATQHAVVENAAAQDQKKSRSRFEYHDGSAEEKRPYRHPELDVDPTNLKLEELRERLNLLEERLERLEFHSNGSNKGR